MKLALKIKNNRTKDSKFCASSFLKYIEKLIFQLNVKLACAHKNTCVFKLCILQYIYMCVNILKNYIYRMYVFI